MSACFIILFLPFSTPFQNYPRFPSLRLVLSGRSHCPSLLTRESCAVTFCSEPSGRR